jgi:hypothetical protein
MNDTAPLEDEVQVEGTDFLQLARDAFSTSTNYVDANLRKQWERNISNFMSRHPAGSKYHSAAYLSRSRIFRPKTRSAVRQNEAAAVAAFFSTQDVVSIQAEDYNNPEARISADLLMELVNYRLTGSSIPWFKIVIGGFQDAQVYGSAIARIEWKFEERKTEQERLAGSNEDGSLVYEPVYEVVDDRPVVSLVPNENLRIHPAADWLDPINSSPYVIELIPMHIKDVQSEMTKLDPKTNAPKWKKLDESQLLSDISENANDSTRQTREGGRQDPTDTSSPIPGHTPVWVHRNIMEIDGEDMQWFTLGVGHLLTDPVPLKEVVLHGMRPYVIGHSVIETHRSNPSGLVELGQELQAASNDNFNQRFDNIKLALNNRSFVRRAASVDLRALKRSVPGGLVMVSDINKDVKPIDVRDVTGSSYADQDRINTDFDEVMGSFSQSSVMSNRKLGETVGGMGMVKDNANVMTEYTIRTYAETFIEPVVRHLVALEKAYETDPKVLQLAKDRAKLPENIEVTNDLLKHAVEVTIDVGYGATDPVRKIQKFSMALNTVAVIPGLIQKLKGEEVVSEVFGNAGYKNGDRFFNGLGEEEQQQGPPPPTAEEQIKMKELQLREIEIQDDARLNQNKLLVDREIAFAKMALEKEIKLSALYENLGVKAGELDLKGKNHELSVLKEIGRRQDQALKRDELNFKASTGRQGI